MDDSFESFRDIAGRPDVTEWYEAAIHEQEGIREMHAVEIVLRPKNRRVIKNRYVSFGNPLGYVKVELFMP
jgi:hypothetical protein